MKKRTGGIAFGVLVAACVISASLAADQPAESTAGKDDVAKSELLTNKNQTTEKATSNAAAVAPLRSVSMWCNTVNAGHTIQIRASNSSGNNISCTSTCYYKQGGANGTLQCTGTVPAHANNVSFCSRSSSNSTFVVTDPGNNNCP
jgi:hypothetical protein